MAMISVLMPVRNCGRYLASALESILAQSLVDIEIVLVDHSSTDDTLAVARRFATADERMRISTYAGPAYLSDVLNFALSRSSAQLVARMDGDDYVDEHRLALQLDALREHDVDVIGTCVRLVDEYGNVEGDIEYPTEHDEIVAVMRRRNPICHASVLMKRDMVLSAGGYRAGLSVAEDLDLWLRIAEAGGAFMNLPDHLYFYRRHASQTSATDPARIHGKLNVLISATFRRCGMNDPFGSDLADWRRPRFDLMMSLPGIDHDAVRGVSGAARGADPEGAIVHMNAAVALLEPYL